MEVVRYTDFEKYLEEQVTQATTTTKYVAYTGEYTSVFAGAPGTSGFGYIAGATPGITIGIWRTAIAESALK